MRKNYSKKRTSHRRQKIYNMKGCSAFFCQTKKRRSPKKMMKGGCAGTCPVSNHSMIGGYLRRGSSSISAKNAKKNKKKMTENARSSDSSSSSSSSRKNSSQRGGSFNIIPQDMTNLFRTIGYSAGSVYNTAGGYPAPVNPAPYASQYGSSFRNNL